MPASVPELSPILERSIALLEELTAISSPSGDANGLERMAARFATALADRGLAVAIHPEPSPEGDRPVLCAGTALSGAGHEPVAGALLAIGHIDTVLAAAPSRRDDNRLQATGAVDMKGGLVAFCGALDLLAARGLQPPAALRLVTAPDEEVGGEISRALVRNHGAVASELWVLEPGAAFGEAETMVAGRRGMFNWDLEVSGRAAHAGLAYWDGRSAIVAASRWCVAATSLARRGSGPTVNVGRLVGGDASFVAELALQAAVLGSDRQLNVVPDRARAQGEVRFLTPAAGQELRRELAGLADEVGGESGTTLRFTSGSIVPPVDPDGPQSVRCARAVELAAARGWSLELERERGGISFPNFLADPTRLPVLDGLGPIGGGMHTREEYVDLRSLGRRIVLLADLLAEATASTAP